MQGIVTKDYRPLVEQVWRLLENEPSTQHKARALRLARGTVTKIEEQIPTGQPITMAPKTVKALHRYLREHGGAVADSTGAAETALRLISVVIQRAEADPVGFQEWADTLLRPGVTDYWRDVDDEEGDEGDTGEG